MGVMVEVVIDSLRVSLTNQQRVVVLHQKDSENYLPIWIGPYEAESITIALQEVEVSRPLTHDLLRNVFQKLQARIMRIEIYNLKDDVFFAHILVDSQNEIITIDSRPSDAIALAVRAHVPIYVDVDVMERAGIKPDQDVTEESDSESQEGELAEAETDKTDSVSQKRLSIFEDFLNGLDIDHPGDEPTEPPENKPE
jgi:uncharacterized protein